LGLGIFIIGERNITADIRGIAPYQTIFSNNFKNEIFKPDAGQDI